ncbi:MAG: hypothetical protein OJF51_000168 [Nitrospira sp.]|nr:MAG: hypothetical protein OJF51_000168 [Nitrospira sp.]
MGPRHLCHGILSPREHTVLQLMWASMGPRHLCHGIAPALYEQVIDSTASMGPRHLCHGIQEVRRTWR